MAAVEVTISGVLYDKHRRTMQNVVLIGEASLTGVGIGGGPLPGGGGSGDAHPEHPIYSPPGIWGPTDPRPNNPISGIPGLPGYTPPPITPPEGPPDGNGFIKPPPAEGGWAYHQTYAWMYDPPAGSAGPK